MFIALAIWKVGFNEPDLIPLVKEHYWISLPMILLGVYIFSVLQNDQHFGHIFQLYNGIARKTSK